MRPEALRDHAAAEEVAAALDATDRHPVVVGGGTPFLPPVTEDVPRDVAETRTFASRVIYERHGTRPAAAELNLPGPPSLPGRPRGGTGGRR